MNFMRRHLTYANVAATLALFLALGGAAYAATQLPRNSVGTGQLKPEAVTAGKIAKKTRNQPRGATGTPGADGTGPAFEVFATGKAIVAGGSVIAAQNLGPGSYVVTANVVVENATATSVTCSLNGGGQAIGQVAAGTATTLSLSATQNLGAAGSATLTCAAPAGATEKYANLIATQVRSSSRVAG